MATKLDCMVTCLEGLLFSKLYDLLIAWFCEMTWQTEISVYLPPQCLEPPKLTGSWLTYRSSNIQRRIAIESRGHARSFGNMKIVFSTTTVPEATKLGKMVIYLDLPNHKAIWPFDHLVFRNHVTNYNHISTNTAYDL